LMLAVRARQAPVVTLLLEKGVPGWLQDDKWSALTLASFIGDGVPVFDIRKNFGITDMLVSDSAKGRALAQALGDKTCALMRGHGVVVVGTSIPIAVGRSIYLDMNAQIQTQAMALGGKVTYLDPQEARKVMDAGENRGYERAWELWKSKIAVK